MADYPDKTTDRYVRESTYRVDAPRDGAAGSLWLIFGGIVVALVLAFAIFSGGGDGVQTVPAGDPAVTIETNPAPDAVTPAPDAMAPAPEPAPLAPAPAEIAPAPEPAPEPAPAAPAPGN